MCGKGLRLNAGSTVWNWLRLIPKELEASAQSVGRRERDGGMSLSVRTVAIISQLP